MHCRSSLSGGTRTRRTTGFRTETLRPSWRTPECPELLQMQWLLALVLQDYSQIFRPLAERGHPSAIWVRGWPRPLRRFIASTVGDRRNGQSNGVIGSGTALVSDPTVRANIRSTIMIVRPSFHQRSARRSGGLVVTGRELGAVTGCSSPAFGDRRPALRKRALVPSGGARDRRAGRRKDEP